MTQNVLLTRSMPVPTTPTGTGGANLDQVASQATSQKQQPAGKRQIAQAVGSSAVLSREQVQQLNPGWTLRRSQSMSESEGRVLDTTRDLQKAGLLVDKNSDSDTVVKPIRMGSGINIPVGSIASGEGTEKVIYDVARNYKELAFNLPNGSTITLSSTRTAGETRVEITNKATGATTSSTFKAVLFFDAKSQTLAFLSSAPGDKFRISDLRALMGTSEPKLAAALKAVGLDSRR